MQDDERAVYVRIPTECGLTHLWQPHTDERLEQIIFSSGMKPRAKELIADARWLAKNPTPTRTGGAEGSAGACTIIVNELHLVNDKD